MPLFTSYEAEALLVEVLAEDVREVGLPAFVRPQVVVRSPDAIRFGCGSLTTTQIR